MYCYGMRSGRSYGAKNFAGLDTVKCQKPKTQKFLCLKSVNLPRAWVNRAKAEKATHLTRRKRLEACIRQVTIVSMLHKRHEFVGKNGTHIKLRWTCKFPNINVPGYHDPRRNVIHNRRSVLLSSIEEGNKCCHYSSYSPFMRSKCHVCSVLVVILCCWGMRVVRRCKHSISDIVEHPSRHINKTKLPLDILWHVIAEAC